MKRKRHVHHYTEFTGKSGRWGRIVFSIFRCACGKTKRMFG